MNNQNKGQEQTDSLKPRESPERQSHNIQKPV